MRVQVNELLPKSSIVQQSGVLVAVSTSSSNDEFLSALAPFGAGGRRRSGHGRLSCPAQHLLHRLDDHVVVLSLPCEPVEEGVKSRG